MGTPHFLHVHRHACGADQKDGPIISLQYEHNHFLRSGLQCLLVEEIYIHVTMLE